MKNNFKKLLAYLLVLMLLSADVAAVAEEVLIPLPQADSVLMLPAGLKTIEEEAFCGNTSIDKVVVPNGTTRILNRAFADSSLKEIELPDTLTFIS